MNKNYQTTGEEDVKLDEIAAQAIEEAIEAVEIKNDELDKPDRHNIERMARDLVDQLLQVLDISR